MSAKNKASRVSSASASAEAPETVAVAVETPEVIAVPEKKPLVGRVYGSRDPYGFGSDTIVSAFFAGIASGSFTRKSLTEALLDNFAGSEEAKRKAVKTSISVAFSDSRRPFGTYHASRSAVILEETGTGRLSFDPERDTAIRSAIEKGILSALRGKTSAEKARILESFGLPSK